MKQELTAQFVSTLMSARTQAHVFHLGTKGPGSFAAHSALNEFYDAFLNAIDGFVESYQGKYGIVSGWGNVGLQDFQSTEQVISYFNTLVAFIEKIRTVTFQDSYLQNQIDEMIQLIYSLLYKLTNLQ
jgi:DNA-binding ferritin-like protein